MSKHIDAEKLIAELRRQKHELELSIQSQGDYGQSCQIVAYENILSLIDSLQQEQPEVDLKEEFNYWLSEVKEEWGGEIPYYGDYGLFCVARHFYELGRLSNK